MTDQKPSGIDLARVALARARAAAKTAPPPAQPRRTTARRRGDATGREPVGLGAAIERFMQDRGWEPAAAGGSILDQWATIAPELAGKVSAEHFDPDTGTLHLRPHVDAYGTHLRLRERDVVARINAAAGGSPVRRLRILPTRAATAAAAEPIPQPAPAAEGPAPARLAGPSAGYQQARQALADAQAAERPEPPPVRTRETASDGYRRARAVYLTNRKPAA